VLLGQGVMPLRHHQTADLMGDEELAHFLGSIKASIDKTVSGLPTHQQYVERYCAAPK
jgi:tryptophan halogenase